MQDFIQQFSFANPQWLLGLIALIPLLFIGGKSGTPTAITYSSLSILSSLGSKPRRLPGFITFSFILLALICAIIAMARPQLRNEQSESTASGVDIILAIDISYSMQIVDFVLNGRRAQRITVAKNTAEAFINQRQNDRMGIVAFQVAPTSPARSRLNMIGSLTSCENCVQASSKSKVRPSAQPSPQQPADCMSVSPKAKSSSSSQTAPTTQAVLLLLRLPSKPPS